MRERSIWRWWGPVLLLALAMLLIASLPTSAMAAFFAHPEHPLRSGPEDLRRSLQGAQWLRACAIIAAIAWVGGALLLLRWRSDQDRASLEPAPRRELIAVSAIVLIAAGMRAPLLFHGLWFDEIAAIGDFTKHGPGPILGAWFTPSNHVLQSLLTWTSDRFVGSDEVSLRLPSFLAGLLTVVAGHALGRRVGGPTLGIATAAVLALMPVAVLESTEARGYALAILFCTIAFWAFVRGMQSGEPWTWVVIALCGALATWSHFVAAFATVGLAIVAVARLLAHRDDRVRVNRALSALVGAGMAGALALALLAPLLPDVIELRSTFRAVEGETPTLISAEGLRFALMLGGTWAAALPPLIAVVPGAALFLIGVCAAARHRDARLAIAASLAGLPLVLLLGASGSWTYARFGSFIVPGVALAIAFALLTLLRWQRQVGVAAAALLTASFVMELSLLPPRQPIRDAMESVARSAQPGDRAADLGIRGNISAFYAPSGMPVVPSGVMGEHLEHTLRDVRVRWVIVTYPDAMPEERWQTLASSGFALAQEWPGWIDWGRGRVQLWKRAVTHLPSAAEVRVP